MNRVTKILYTLLLILNLVCGKFNAFEHHLEKLRDAFKNIKNHPDAGLDIYEFLEKYNYPVETHWTTTEDGYILGMHRITAGQNNSNHQTSLKPAVLLMHGMTSTSIDWVNSGPKRSLGLALADAGYDVWLGNNRGNTWSRNHTTLDPDVDKEFWNFSFEHCGHYDIPAKIDYILNTTGHQKLFFVGYSQGTTEFFAMASLRPEYNDKIALMSALAPVAYMGHIRSPLLKIATNMTDILEEISEIFHWYEFFRFNPAVSQFCDLLCSDGSPTQELCAMFIYLGCGYDPVELDKSLITVLTSNLPAGVSLNMLVHFTQQIKSGHFRRFDYGAEINRELYNSDTPPDFNVFDISAPVALYYGENDLLATTTDVQQLASELPNLVKNKMVDSKTWNHADFLIGKSVYEKVNLEVLANQQEYIDNGMLNTNK